MRTTTAALAVAVVALCAVACVVADPAADSAAADATTDAAAAVPATPAAPAAPTVEQRTTCEACHLVMDSFYAQLMSVFIKRRKSTRGVVELKGDELALQTCVEMAKQPHLYGPTALKMCNSFLTDHRSELLSIFSRNFEINDNVDNFYQLKHQLCERVHDGCMRPQHKPKIDTCDACKLLMEDIERVFSWGLGGATFGQRTHVYRVLDDLCLNLLVRHPVRYHHTLLEVCGDLTDDYATAIVSAIQKSLGTKGPAPAREICIKTTKLCPKEDL